MKPYAGRYPTRVACKGHVYRAHSPEQLDMILRVLEQGRFVDADRLFDIEATPSWRDGKAQQIGEG